MVYIVQVPLHYQRSSYPPIHKPSFQTTKADSWILNSDTTLGQTIGRDAAAWGWNIIYHDISQYSNPVEWPNPLRWILTTLESERYRHQLAELWSIWQHEHGYRILKREEEKREMAAAGNMRKTKRVVHKVKKAGKWMKRQADMIESIEMNLRKYEEAKARLRQGQRGQIEEGHVILNTSLLSLPDLVLEKLENARGDVEAQKTSNSHPDIA